MCCQLKSDMSASERKSAFIQRENEFHPSKVAKCQLFYTDKIFQTKFYPKKPRLNHDKFNT